MDRTLPRLILHHLTQPHTAPPYRAYYCITSPPTTPSPHRLLPQSSDWLTNQVIGRPVTWLVEQSPDWSTNH